jgi:hypothetical protein
MDSELNTYPRKLSGKEWNLTEWLLPPERPGYRAYRSYLETLQVIGTGRWGIGNLILGEPGDEPDRTGPMARVFAYGSIETDDGRITVSVHEFVEGQLELQMANLQDGGYPDSVEGLRKSTYSSWEPGSACPFCGGGVREVAVNRTVPRAKLVLCAKDASLWIFDESDGVNHPLPATNYFNELMMYKKVKDPAVALDAKNLFRKMDLFPDAELREAFIRYNKTWYRIKVRPEVKQSVPERAPLIRKFVTLFKR